jgi:hypothetical protein
MHTFVETKLFSKLVQEYLTDDEYAEQQHALIAHPQAGDVIPGSGGVRKLRWKMAGHGKRGGLRVIYYLRSAKVSFGCSRSTPRTCQRTFPPTS